MYSTDSHLVARGVRLFPQNRGEEDNLKQSEIYQPGYNGHGKIDFFPSILRGHTHSLIYEPNDGCDCRTPQPPIGPGPIEELEAVVIRKLSSG